LARQTRWFSLIAGDTWWPSGYQRLTFGSLPGALLRAPSASATSPIAVSLLEEEGGPPP